MPCDYDHPDHFPCPDCGACFACGTECARSCPGFPAADLRDRITALLRARPGRDDARNIAARIGSTRPPVIAELHLMRNRGLASMTVVAGRPRWSLTGLGLGDDEYG